MLPAAASHFRYVFEGIAGISGIVGSVVLLKTISDELNKHHWEVRYSTVDLFPFISSSTSLMVPTVNGTLFSGYNWPMELAPRL